MRHHRISLLFLLLLPYESRASVRLRSRLEEGESRRGGLAGLEDARQSTLGETGVPRAADLWPRLAAEMNSRKSEPVRSPAFRRRWAMGTAGVLAAVLGGLLFLTPRRTAEVDPLVKLRVDSVKIYGQPARAFIFQTRDADSTFVWVEKQDSGQGEKL